MSLRMDKVNREMQKQLMYIISHEIDDPLAGFLSIVRVDTNADLRESRVYFSILDERQYDKVEKILRKMSTFIRCHLAKRIRLKILPELKFIPDDSIKYSVDIYQKIEEIKEEEERIGGE